MTRTFVPFRRIAALSVAITLFASPIASAQTPAPASNSDAPAKKALLSPAAFAHLMQAPPANAAPAPVVADSPRPRLLRQGTTAMARQAHAATTKAPGSPNRSWMARHKWAFIIPGIVAGGILGAYGILYLVYGDD